MFDNIENHISKMIDIYASDKFYSELVKAKDIFFKLTGNVNDETDEFEARMNCFYDWYIFHFRLSNGWKIIEDYIHEYNLDDEMAKALLNVNYSFFQFKKIDMKKRIVLFDVLHNKKITLGEDSKNIGLLEDDIFIGRSVKIDKKEYILNGVCHLPSNVFTKLKKHSKEIRPLNNLPKEEEFLLKIESLKTKSLQYGHIDASKIFVFS